MNEEERKDDIKKFSELQDSMKALWKELGKEDNNDLLEGKNRDEFIEALNNATDFVNGLSPYFDSLKLQQQILDCDFRKGLEDKEVKKVIRAQKKELNKLAEQVKNTVKLHPLTYLFLEVTLRCNAKCEHCGSSCSYKIPKDEISAEELKKSLLEIANAYGSENVFINITGGEPLMRKDLFEIMKYAVSLGYHWGMTTNAMLINEKTIKDMRESNFESISISLDGLKETHDNFRKVPGAFDRIMKAIDLLKGLETLKHLQVTTVANKKNLHELEDIYQLMLDKGIKEWRVMCVDPIGRAADNDDVLLDKEGMLYMLNFIAEKRREGKIKVDYDCSHFLGYKFENLVRDNGFYCAAGLNIGSILANGDICVCPNVRRKELVQGNIKTDSFVDIWENKFEQFRTKRITTNNKCKSCKSFKYCRGDSFHTWNFDEKVPNMCMKELLQEEFVE